MEILFSFFYYFQYNSRKDLMNDWNKRKRKGGEKRKEKKKVKYESNDIQLNAKEIE